MWQSGRKKRLGGVWLKTHNKPLDKPDFFLVLGRLQLQWICRTAPLIPQSAPYNTRAINLTFYWTHTSESHTMAKSLDLKPSLTGFSKWIWQLFFVCLFLMAHPGYTTKEPSLLLVVIPVALTEIVLCWCVNCSHCYSLYEVNAAIVTVRTGVRDSIGSQMWNFPCEKY